MEHIDALSLESRFKRLRDALTEFARQVLPEVAMNTCCANSVSITRSSNEHSRQFNQLISEGMEHIDALSLESRFKRLRDALTEFALQVLQK